MQKNKLFFLAILILAFSLRFYGQNWDQGQHLHPDERFLTMVLTSMKIPKSFGDYFNPAVSTMSPYNVGYGFFVYGTFPLNLTKILGVLTHNDNYYNIHLLGRMLSALFDIGVVYLLYLISKKLLNTNLPITNHQSLITPLLSAFLYSIMVLPIQLSHFFAVDTFLNFFIVLSFYFLINLISTHKTNRSVSVSYSVALGFSFGTALACKISAVLFLPIIGFGFLFYLLKSKKIIPFVLCVICFGLCAYAAFRFNQPQAFSTNNWFNLIPSPQFLKNLQEMRSQGDPNSTFPPAVQWIPTKPIVFSLKNLVLWGMGLPLGITCLVSLFYPVTLAFAKMIRSATSGKQLLNYLITKKEKLSALPIPQSANFLIIFWILFLFIFQSVQFAKNNRYFLPIYPFLALLSAQFLIQLSTFLEKRFTKSFGICNLAFVIFLLIYPLSFMNIYAKPITRVRASEWIYKNIPVGSILLNEEWDDGLPLSLTRQNSQIYKYKSVFMYDIDTSEKWQRIQPVIDVVDYIVITSNRAYGSTMNLPERYPKTIEYYQSLFKGAANFKRVAEFTSYPCFPPGKFNLFCFNDDSSEESFTVYDHPKVMIFKRN